MRNGSLPLMLVAATFLTWGCEDPAQPESPPVAVSPSLAGVAGEGNALWPLGGHDLSNTRRAARGVQISPANVAGLAVKVAAEG